MPSAAEWGFDDDDEPLDDDDPAAVRQSGEQQAIDLLRQTLGAEKIGEVDTH
jgi:DNA polymerase-3 subunit gamma/tau